MSDKVQAALYEFVAILLDSAAFGGTVNMLEDPTHVDWRVFGGSLAFAVIMSAKKYVELNPPPLGTTRSHDSGTAASTNPGGTPS